MATHLLDVEAKASDIYSTFERAVKPNLQRVTRV